MIDEAALDDLEGLSTNGNGNRRWDPRRVSLLREERGNRCEQCGKRGRVSKKGKPNLEFAHKAPTALNGRGRGQIQRYYDIRKNPDAYELLCTGCHDRTR